jgi:hypothetical protein
MIRGFGNAVVAIVAASLIDRYFYAGHYADAALAMLGHIQRSFGL